MPVSHYAPSPRPPRAPASAVARASTASQTHRDGRASTTAPSARELAASASATNLAILSSGESSTRTATIRSAMRRASTMAASLALAQVLLGPLRTRRVQAADTYLCQSACLPASKPAAAPPRLAHLRTRTAGRLISLGPAPDLVRPQPVGENRTGTTRPNLSVLQSAHAFTFYHFTHCRPRVAGKRPATAHRDGVSSAHSSC